MIDTLNDHKDDLLLAVERFELVAKATHDVIWDWDLVKSTVWWNEGMQQIFGHPASEVEQGPNSWFDRIHPEDQENVLKKIHAVIENGESNWSNVYRFRKGDGSYAYVHDRGYTIQSEGKPVRMVGSMMDITEQLKSEQARKESEEKVAWADQRAAMTIEGSGAGSFLVMLDTNEVIYSPTMAKILTGKDSSRITRDIFVDHIHPEDMLVRKDAYDKALKTGQLRYEARFIWKDKSIHWIRVIGQYLYDGSGKAVSLSGIVMDITDRIQSEQRLKTNEEHLRTLIEQAPVATALFVGREMIIEMPNEAMLKVWGKGNSVTGKPLKEALPELIDQPFLKILDQIYETGEPYAEPAARCELVMNGVLETFYFNFTYKPLRNSKGEIYAILDMAVDVTDQVTSRQDLEKSEERYRQLASELERRVQQRTEELHLANQELVNSNNNLQQFAYAASHDMQEPLRKIQAFGSRLQSVYAKELDENGAFMLNRIQDASKRMSVMIDDLLAYSRLTTRETEFKPVALNDIVTNVLADLEISIQEQNTEILVKSLPVVWGNALQLTQLMQNLVSNAIKYKFQGQLSKIKISSTDADPATIKVLPKLLQDHSYICLEVEDNGIGFDEAYLDRIFQMFQRLHGRGEFSGSGIGLALCKKVVQNHHGYITARSTPGKGSVFIVYLPKPL
ncbi:PAS domain-containing sensor histidine kinase [Dyadobacter pollutisoli]|uniref:histidine kinase n=1 Tax=Dyadobacter pollutisoli TaxID=2910158 RepID=A0A9E8NBS1_9BACT|nr:PAS domain-containing protein [Dyadobacter pollutisoli]WAC13744.1 PAS domain-containing protein [Dyadobacter pollutisoli]